MDAWRDRWRDKWQDKWMERTTITIATGQNQGYYIRRLVACAVKGEWYMNGAPCLDCVKSNFLLKNCLIFIEFAMAIIYSKSNFSNTLC
jgi:hypothetical protein